MAIYMWREWQWQPWANTIAYYPLHEDIDDEVWNYPWTSGAATFSNNMATITTSLRRTWTWFQNNSWDFTICAWWICSPTEIMFKWDGNRNASLVISFSADHMWIQYYSSWWKTFETTWTLGNIYNIIGVKKSGTLYVYINGTLAGSLSAPNYPWYSWSSWDTAQIAQGNICADVIIESVPWTATEIADYYNQTKANYWL